MNDLRELVKKSDPLRRHPMKALSGPEATTVGQALFEDSRASEVAARAVPAAARPWQERWWPRVVAPLALVAVLGGVSLTRHGGTYALAQQATPQLISFQHGSHDSAATLLRAAATKAAAVPISTGPVLHSVTQSWTLSTDVHRKTSTSALLTSTRELWITAQGTGRLVDTIKQTPVTVGQATSGSTVSRSNAPVSPATFANSNAGLPTDAATLAPVIRKRSRAMGLSPDENVGGYILDNIEEGTATTAQTAAMLALLADVPQVFDAGPVVDRAGRVGHAVGLVTSGPTSPTTGTVYLIIDSRTGLPLASETMWTPDPPRGLHLRPGPMVAEYHLYLSSAQVATAG